MAISVELVPEELGLHHAAFVGAFMGYADASLGASGAVRYLAESLRASPMATWDGDEFYDFVELRPVSRVVPPRDRTLIWPQGEFWVARDVPLAEPRPEGETTRSLVLFLAPEPRLKWRTYGRELAAFAKRCAVTQGIFLGAALADVPHTRPAIVTGWATESRLRTRLEALGVQFSAYQGPSSMQSAAIESFRETGIASASLFSNGPHYLTVPNANLSLGLLRRLLPLLGVQADLSLLQQAGEALVQQANVAMEDRPDFREHVRQLETQFDEQATPLAPGEVRREMERREAEQNAPMNVDPHEVVRELEDFLRKRARSQRSEDEQGGAPGSEDAEGEKPDDETGEQPAP